jgi:hypothetical protein
MYLLQGHKPNILVIQHLKQYKMLSDTALHNPFRLADNYPICHKNLLLL